MGSRARWLTNHMAPQHYFSVTLDQRGLPTEAGRRQFRFTGGSAASSGPADARPCDDRDFSRPFLGNREERGSGKKARTIGPLAGVTRKPTNSGNPASSPTFRVVWS